MPAFGRLVSGIMPATEITSPSRPGMMPDHTGDPGTVCSVLAPHDHLHISHDIVQRTICDLPLAIRASLPTMSACPGLTVAQVLSADQPTRDAAGV